MARIASLNVYSAPKVDDAFQVRELRRAIKKLKNGKVPGVDLVTAELLAAAIDNDEDPIIAELTRIFNKVFEDGAVPKAWQKAVVRPVFKTGDRTAWDNY